MFAKPLLASKSLRCVTFVVAFSVSLSAGAATVYVNAANPTPGFPYGSWGAAATNIQDAVDVAVPGDTVLVTNGVYQFGGNSIAAGATNRVSVTNAIILRSVNGPAVTLIVGYQDPVTTIGANAIRCVYLASGAVLSGFTLTNGATQDLNSGSDLSGGAALCESRSAVITNCVLTGNVARSSGGGVYSGQLDHCWLTGNRTVRSSGGGAANAALYNCVICSNSAAMGGGAAGSSLTNCTVVGNFAFVAGSGSGIAGGTSDCWLYNTIVYYNDDTSGMDLNTASTIRSWFTCTTPGTGWYANITNEPAFVDLAAGNFHLQTDSPCINSGANLYTPPGPDLDNNPRTSGGKTDLGAFEVQNPSSMISYAWLAANGFPTDGSADFADPDGDRMNNWQEWIAGTDPQDPASLLRMYPPTTGSVPGSVLVSWQSVDGRTYFLERSTNLAQAGFTLVDGNIFSQVGTNYYQDYPPADAKAVFYRVWTDPERFVFP